MESRVFIREAAALVKDIEDFKVLSITLPQDENDRRGADLNRRTVALLSGLQNPTLMAAARLRQVAVDAGFGIPPNILARLDQGEELWGL